MLTTNAPSNDYTVYFDQPIPKPNYIRLLNCSLYNSWHNLKENGEIDIYSKKIEVIFFPGYYTINNLVKEIKTWVLKDASLITLTNTPYGELFIHNKNKEQIGLSNNLASLMNISENSLMEKNATIKKLNTPRTYFIHCDLIDKENNLFNGKPSSILANFDIKGEALERVFCQPEPQHVLRDTSSDAFVRSLNISVKDENGNLSISMGCRSLSFWRSIKIWIKLLCM